MSNVNFETQPHIISYKMTNDSGFAPNPFFGVLTLATCKPAIRRSKNVKKGDWIAGWSSVSLHGDPIGGEKLVYLALIDDIIPINEYWENFKEKRNNGMNDNSLESFGDNIYEPDGMGGFIAQPNYHHNPDKYPELKKIDTGGKNVLICKTFYYFGKERMFITNDYSLKVPKYKGHQFSPLNFDFINYVESQFTKMLNGVNPDDFYKQIKNVTSSTGNSNLIHSRSSSCCKK